MGFHSALKAPSTNELLANVSDGIIVARQATLRALSSGAVD